MGSVSYWQAEVAAGDGDADEAAPRRYPTLEGDSEAEIAIVGGGITGASAALWLARAGVRAAVLEGRTIAAGASGRNGGFLLAGTAESYATAIARYGRERARRIWDFSTRNQRLAASLADELAALGWATGFRRTGSLRIAATDAELAELVASDALQREDGWDAELLPRDRLPACIQAYYTGAAYYPGDGEIQPARFVAGLARLAEQAGAAIYETSPVARIEPEGAGVRITTDGGTLRAGAALLATNAWLPEMLGPLGDGAATLAGAIVSTRGQMLVTAPVTERLFDSPCYADEGYQYWRQLEDGRLVVGGWRNTSFATENTSDETPGGAVQSSLDAFVHETLGLAGLPIERRWAGIMAFSRDGLPYVGRLPGQQSNLYVAGGYTGHGNASAILAARTIADLILGQPTPDADLFDPARIFSEKQAAQ